MAERFSLRDHLFNPTTIGQLANEYADALPDFDARRFREEVLAGLPARELLERLDWIADCLEPQLAPDFPTMADQLEAAMPPLLDPAQEDDDFGQFIHAVPGILAVRHGLERHRERALDLLHEATRRFSMEFYIRPFLNRWPDETLARLETWAGDDNYHVRRLVSEGTRPKLPWAKAVTLTRAQTLPLLDALHGDPTRYVTRSVANHLNDIAKGDADAVLDRLAAWTTAGKQTARELDWMTRHALRTLVKAGHSGALAMLGYDGQAEVSVTVQLADRAVRIGDNLSFTVTLEARQDLPVLVDYRLRFAGANGKTREKVFKLKTARMRAGVPLVLKKNHRMKGDATTFRLFPGTHGLIVQVNGVDRAAAAFEVVAG